MNSYVLLIFFHVLGAVGMFAAWTIEASTLQRLRQSVSAGEARACAERLRKQGPIGRCNHGGSDSSPPHLAATGSGEHPRGSLLRLT